MQNKEAPPTGLLGEGPQDRKFHTAKAAPLQTQDDASFVLLTADEKLLCLDSSVLTEPGGVGAPWLLDLRLHAGRATRLVSCRGFPGGQLLPALASDCRMELEEASCPSDPSSMNKTSELSSPRSALRWRLVRRYS